MTSLKVAVRVRPLSERESDLGSSVVVDVCGKDILVTDVKVPENRGCDHRVRVHRFTFDYGFWSVDPTSKKCASQKTVYEEFGRVVLNTLLDGYNSCVIAYGPSGSGKTYTMMGTKEENGLTPRICEGLFQKLTDKTDNHLPFQIDISFMEIYNEQVFDLLQANETGSNRKPKLRVREHPIRGPFVEEGKLMPICITCGGNLGNSIPTDLGNSIDQLPVQGLSTHIVNNIDTVCDLLARGNENRVKAATHVHDRSTRSHAIFTIRCSQACLDETKPREVISKLHLVDLAGSEKAAPEFCRTRVKEGGNINKSLVTLGNVISVLVEMSQQSKSSHAHKRTFVPYRDSNLTWLLKDSLGGNSHTFMLAAISPSRECYIETVSTLRYAQRAKFVMNRPVVNEDPVTEMIKNLQTEVSRLKNLLSTAEKLNRAYVMKPLPEMVQLRSVMEESAKRVDELTKHWFEKWLKTYSVVVNKVLDNSIDRRLRNNLGLTGVKTQRSPERCLLSAEPADGPTEFEDSLECITMQNGAVNYSKKKSIDTENSRKLGDTFADKKFKRGSSIPHATSKTPDQKLPRRCLQGVVRSYSDTSLRRISGSAPTPLFRFLSLSDTNTSYPPCKYSWLTKSVPDESKSFRLLAENEIAASCKPSSKENEINQSSNLNIHEEKSNSFISSKVSLPKERYLSEETSLSAVNQTVLNTLSTKNCEASFLKTEVTDQQNIVSQNGHCSLHEDLPVSQTLVKPILQVCLLMEQNVSEVTSPSLSSGQEHFCVRVENTGKEPKGQHIDEADDFEGNRVPVEFICAVDKFSEAVAEGKDSAKLLIPFANTREIANGKTLQVQEISFSEQVVQESRNLLEYLKTIGHDSTESGSGCCSPRRKDSEIMSLLSFSSLDVPFFRSLDELSLNEDNGNECENVNQDFINGQRRTPDNHAIDYDGVVNSNQALSRKIVFQDANVDEKADILHEEGTNNCGTVGNRKSNGRSIEYGSSGKVTENEPLLRDVLPVVKSMTTVSDMSSASPNQELKYNSPSGPMLYVASENRASTPEKAPQQHSEVSEFTSRVSEGITSKPAMKLTKANLDLLAEELNGKSEELGNYLDACMAFTQSIDHDDSEVPRELCSGSDAKPPIEKSSQLSHWAEVSAGNERNILRLPDEGKVVYNFGCWGKTDDNGIEERMKKVQDEMKEIEIMLGMPGDETDLAPQTFCDSARFSEALEMVSTDEVTRNDLRSPCAEERAELWNRDSQGHVQCTFPHAVQSILQTVIPSKKDEGSVEMSLSESAASENQSAPEVEKSCEILALDVESDFNDTFTLDSLDNFDQEMRAWADKYLTKRESQSSNWSASDKAAYWQNDEPVSKEGRLTPELVPIDGRGQNSVPLESESCQHKENFHRHRTQSTCSSSSSDSITYVFVGKDEKNSPKSPAVFSKSQCSSLLSSVSVDSLEKTSLQHRPQFLSPRTLSIDSLVAEDLLDQLRKGRLPSASKTGHTLDDNNYQPNSKEVLNRDVVKFSDFAPSLLSSTPKLEWVASEQQPTLKDVSNRSQACDMFNNLSISQKNEERCSLSFSEVAKESVCPENNDAFFNQPRSAITEEGVMLQCKSNNNSKNSITDRHTVTPKGLDFSNINGSQERKDGCGIESTQVKCHFSQNWDRNSCSNSSGNSMCQNDVNFFSRSRLTPEKLAAIFIPPPASFAKVDSINENLSHCQKSPLSATSCKRISRATQTDDQLYDKPCKISSSMDADHMELTLRVIELMTETIKCLKENKRRGHSCCLSHHKSCRQPKMIPPSESESTYNSWKPATYSSKRVRSKHPRHKAVAPASQLDTPVRVVRRKDCRSSQRQFSAVDSCGAPPDTPPIFNLDMHFPKAGKGMNVTCDKAVNLATDTAVVLPSSQKTDEMLSGKRTDFWNENQDTTVDFWRVSSHVSNRRSEMAGVAHQVNHNTIALTGDLKSPSEPRQNSPKNHLQQLVEIRRRVVEETKGLQNRAEQCSHKKQKELSANEVNAHRKRSTSSSSEGYLSSVSSRGIFSRLSETPADSSAFDSASRTDSKLYSATPKTNRSRPKLLEVRRSSHSQGTANTSWQNTSADSGAFFMDSPLAEKYDFVEVSTAGISEAMALRNGQFMAECSVQDPGVLDLRKIPDVSVVTTVKDDKNIRLGATSKTAERYSPELASARTESPRISLLEEFRQNFKGRLPRDSKSFKPLNSSLAEERSCLRSLEKPFEDSRADLVKKLADVNYKVTREDIERVLASIEADKEFLRRRRNPLIDKRFSPKLRLCSMGSEDDIFPYDSYMRLPDPSLFIGTSA